MKAFGLFIEMKQKIKKKIIKKKVCLFLSCFWAYVGQPHDHIGWSTPMPFASINPTNPRTNPWNFHEKILRIGGAGKWGFYPFFLSRPFWIFFFKKEKKKFLLHLNEKTNGFHMRYHLFLQYGWFLQNLVKDFIPTNMHTTVTWFFNLLICLFQTWFLLPV